MKEKQTRATGAPERLGPEPDRAYRITIAEDDENVLFLIQHLISTAFPKAKIAAFTNGGDALAHILNTGTDILITDHGLGPISGTQVIRELRTKGLSIPIIMVSGDPRAQAEAQEAGATDFLYKTEALGKLADYVRRLLPA